VYSSIPVVMPDIYTDYPISTISHVLNAETVECIGRGGHNGFVIFGFASSAADVDGNTPADGASSHLLPNMGFAVFEYHNKVGYRLVDWHLYENAAVEGNGIYLAEDLAVADRYGRATRSNSYEVLLIFNDRFDHLERRTHHREIANIVVQHPVHGYDAHMILFPRADDPVGQDIYMTLYDIDGKIMPVGMPERVSVTQIIGNTNVHTTVLSDPEEALALLTEIENFPYLTMDHPIYGGYEWHDGFIIRIEYVTRDDLVLHDDMRDCLVFAQGGAYYLLDRHHDYRNSTIREITKDFYDRLTENYAIQ